ncbi:MAG: hypothetical protein Q7U97_14235 [Rhodocyclaceae bacterium]|nr:hypothetical protein [Rhodocyclaceae bacterium]
MPAITKTCGACRHWTANPTERLTNLGFGLCAHMPVWRYLSQNTTCDLKPSRFEEAK